MGPWAPLKGSELMGRCFNGGLQWLYDGFCKDSEWGAHTKTMGSTLETFHIPSMQGLYYGPSFLETPIWGMHRGIL